MTTPITTTRSGRPPRRYHKKKKKTARTVKIVLLLLLLLIVAAVLFNHYFLADYRAAGRVSELAGAILPDNVDVQIIDVDGDSRRGEKLEGVNDIVVHYVGNPGSSAQANHDYYTNDDSTVSSHFVVGLEGEVIQCIPLDEKSSASNWRNNDTISIEVCHPDESGRFNEASYESLVALTAWLCDACDLNRERIIRHYDVSGKRCPLYFVEHEDAWEQFKKDVADY